MLSYRMLLKNIRITKLSPCNHGFALRRLCDTSSSNEDTKKTKDNNKKKSQDALEKLNVLLKKMVEDDSRVITKSKLNLAKPRPKYKVRTEKTDPENATLPQEPNEKHMMKAVKDVAESIGGDVKQTESELLSKLLNPNGSDKSELSKKQTPINLSDIIAGMKIDRSDKPVVNNEASRAHQVRKLLDRSEARTSKDRDTNFKYSSDRREHVVQRKSKKEGKPIDLFGSAPLGIFTSQSSASEDKIKLEVWDSLQKRELRLAITHPPENYFQEMILWTNQGKIWKFPIDNEQGMEEEQNVYFADHVFLDRHLEPWCPPRGPIRHFMELVCVGLSKNPYLSVADKRAHIQWYKDYFMARKQMLQEIGAMPSDTVAVENKQIE